MIAAQPLKPLEPPYPRSYDPNAKCDYHVRAVGHSIEWCWSSRPDRCRELRFKKNEPNVNTNPLPARGGQSINTLSHEILSTDRTEANPADLEEVAVLGQDGGHLR
ncbi:hypothetical protein CR513_47293, partial [Mucuna pruriens]